MLTLEVVDGCSCSVWNENKGAIGLVLPMLTGILPILTSLAVVGLALVMVGAIISHFHRGGENQTIVMNVILMALAIFVAFGGFMLIQA
mgnify:CR=1 FL=1